MAGVQMVPAVAAVDSRAEGSMMRKRRVAGTSLFAGDWRRRSRRPACSVRALRQSKSRGGLGIVCNLGGQYEDSFDDVQLVNSPGFVRWMDLVLMFLTISISSCSSCARMQQLMNYFTYKAARTVLTQLYEMNPPSYRWLYK
jgi:hypothetical protein